MAFKRHVVRPWTVERDLGHDLLSIINDLYLLKGGTLAWTLFFQIT